MKNFAIKIILLLSLTFISCDSKHLEFKGNADEIMEMCIKQTEYRISKKAFVEIEGVIGWIAYPIDYFNPRKCTVYLETKNSDSKKRSGYFIACRMKNRLPQDLIGKKVLIQGQFDIVQEIDDDIFLIIKKCVLVNDL